MTENIQRFKRLYFWTALSILSVLLILYFMFDPAEYAWMPKCMLHYFTGLECPGCGSQRAVHALLHGDLPQAFKANALLVCLIPGLIFLAIVEIKRMKWPRLYMALHRPMLIIIFTLIIVAWGIVRNIF